MSATICDVPTTSGRCMRWKGHTGPHATPVEQSALPLYAFPSSGAPKPPILNEITERFSSGAPSETPPAMIADRCVDCHWQLWMEHGQTYCANPTCDLYNATRSAARPIEGELSAPLDVERWLYMIRNYNIEAIAYPYEWRALAAALPNLLRAASERDKAKREIQTLRNIVQRLTDELAEANMLFSLSSLRQQVEALSSLEPVKDGGGFNGAAMVTASNGRYVELDAVLQLLTPHSE